LGEDDAIGRLLDPGTNEKRREKKRLETNKAWDEESSGDDEGDLKAAFAESDKARKGVFSRRFSFFSCAFVLLAAAGWAKGLSGLGEDMTREI
jgi:hypothetical protein